MIQRLHGKCLVENPRPGLQIHQGVIHITAARDSNSAAAHFDRRVNLVAGAGNAIGLGRRIIAQAQQLAEEHYG